MTMYTQLCTLRTGSYALVFHIGLYYTDGHDHIIIAGNRKFPGLEDGRRTVLNAGLQSAKSRSYRKLKMEMSLYSRSTTVIHHDSPWLIRHDTLSVRVRQSSGNRSGSGINCMHANYLCGESGVFVIRYHNTMS